MEKPIIQAAKDKESLLLRSLITAGGDPNTQDAYGETGLTWAAHLGHTPIVKDLLAAGAGVEQTGNLFRATPLILAARGGYRGIVALLAVHAELDAQDEKGATALMRAVEIPEGRVKSRQKVMAVLKTLLDAGASPNIQDQGGYTALMWAVRWHNPEAISYLLNAGADRSIRNYAGKTACALADEAGEAELVKLFIL